MFAFLRSRVSRRGLIVAGATAATMTLVAACGQTFPSGPLLGQGEQPEVPADTIGSGNIKVGLLLPFSATGNAGRLATTLRNAAELALADFPSADIQLIPLDTKGTPEEAQNAAQTARAAGARLIIGPLFANSVRAVGSVARSASIPVIAFSTDSSAASPGVYLLSFLPSSDIERIVNYAARNGKKSIAALLPEGTYGTIALAALQQTAARHGVRVSSIERYGADKLQMQQAVQRIASVAGGTSPSADALLMPDGPVATSNLAPLLALSNIDGKRVQFLGSGQWDGSSLWRLPQFNGGWYAAPAPAGRQAFVGKYRSRFGSEPERIATLAYDAVSLAAALSRMSDGISDRVLTNSDGFNGLDGLFRFRNNGTNQRGLAILEVASGSSRVREAAPRSFASF